MATCLVTPRDNDLFAALARCPLTVRQLLAVSATFAYPFTSERRVQERLQRLCAAGRLRRWFYATAGQGALSYYTLTPEGYRLLHGPDARLPGRGLFGPIGVARQRHSLALAEFLVHLGVSAHRAQVEIGNFHRENEVPVRLGDETLYPDSAFDLIVSEATPFRFALEIDNGTESVRSQESLDTWQRKIAFYERFQDAEPERFRVLAVTTGGRKRVESILQCARNQARNPRRSLVLGVTLAEFQAETEPLTASCFRDHHGRNVSLLPGRQTVILAQERRAPVGAGIAAARVIPSPSCLEPLPQA